MSAFKPRTATVPLYGGDYQQRIAEAEARLIDAERRAQNDTTEAPTGQTLDEESEVDRLRREHDELVAEADAEGRTDVTLSALGRRAWAALVEAHPPRTDESVPEKVREEDAAVGVNESTFGEALLAYRDDRLKRSTIVNISDDMTTDELLDEISDVQFSVLYGTAFALNRSLGPTPKARGTRPSPSGSATAR